MSASHLWSTAWEAGHVTEFWMWPGLLFLVLRRLVTMAFQKSPLQLYERLKDFGDILAILLGLTWTKNTCIRTHFQQTSTIRPVDNLPWRQRWFLGPCLSTPGCPETKKMRFKNEWSYNGHSQLQRLKKTRRYDGKQVWFALRLTDITGGICWGRIARADGVKQRVGFIVA